MFPEDIRIFFFISIDSKREFLKSRHKTYDSTKQNNDNANNNNIWWQVAAREVGRVVTVRRSEGGEKDSRSFLLWDFSRSFCHFASLSLRLCRRQICSFSRSRDATCESSPVSETHCLLPRRAPPRTELEPRPCHRPRPHVFGSRLKIEASRLFASFNLAQDC